MRHTRRGAGEGEGKVEKRPCNALRNLWKSAKAKWKTVLFYAFASTTPTQNKRASVHKEKTKIEKLCVLRKLYYERRYSVGIWVKTNRNRTSKKKECLILRKFLNGRANANARIKVYPRPSGSFVNLAMCHRRGGRGG